MWACKIIMVGVHSHVLTHTFILHKEYWIFICASILLTHCGLVVTMNLNCKMIKLGIKNYIDILTH